MKNENTRPSAGLFGEVEVQVSKGKRGADQDKKEDFFTIQTFLRQRLVISMWELDQVKDLISGAKLSYPELVSLEGLVKMKAVEAERVQGWHSGFMDVSKLLLELRKTSEVA